MSTNRPHITAAKLRSGAPEALAALCKSRGAIVFAYCQRAVGRDDAAEAAAAAFAQLRIAALSPGTLASSEQAERLLRSATRRAAMLYLVDVDRPGLSACAQRASELLGYVENALTPADRRVLTAHVGRCHACAEALRRLQGAEETFKVKPSTRLGHAVAAKIVTALAQAAPVGSHDGNPLRVRDEALRLLAGEDGTAADPAPTTVLPAEPTTVLPAEPTATAARPPEPAPPATEPAPSATVPPEPAPTTALPPDPAPTTTAPSEPAPTTGLPPHPAPTTTEPSEPAPTAAPPPDPAPTTTAPSEPAPTTPPPPDPAPTTTEPSEPAPTTGLPPDPAPSTTAPSEPAPTPGQPPEPTPTAAKPLEPGDGSRSAAEARHVDEPAEQPPTPHLPVAPATSARPQPVRQEPPPAAREPGLLDRLRARSGRERLGPSRTAWLLRSAGRFALVVVAAGAAGTVFGIVVATLTGGDETSSTPRDPTSTTPPVAVERLRVDVTSTTVRPPTIDAGDGARVIVRARVENSIGRPVSPEPPRLLVDNIPVAAEPPFAGSSASLLARSFAAGAVAQGTLRFDLRSRTPSELAQSRVRLRLAGRIVALEPVLREPAAAG